MGQIVHSMSLLGNHTEEQLHHGSNYHLIEFTFRYLMKALTTSIGRKLRGLFIEKTPAYLFKVVEVPQLSWKL